MFLLKFLKSKKKLEAPFKKYYDDSNLDIKIPNISLYKQILDVALKNPNKIAIRYYNKKIPYKKFIKNINICSNSFKILGINKGDVVTILMPNMPEALICFYALNKIGAIASFVHSMSSSEEIEKIVKSTSSKILIVADLLYDTTCSIDSKIIYVSPSNSMGMFMKLAYKLTKRCKFKNTKMHISFNKFMKLSKKTKVFLKESFNKNTKAVILNSGGTSGDPKNVVIQNKSFLLNSIQAKIVFKKLELGDSFLSIMPNFHGFGLSVSMHIPLSLGCTVILVPKFNSKKFDKLINKYKPNFILGVPTLFESLLNQNNLKNLDLSYLKYMISGGDTLGENLKCRINKYLKNHNSNISILEGYGLTEALSAVCLEPEGLNKKNSIGIPLPGNYIKIIDPKTRNTLPPLKVGEICVYTDAVMMGYLNDEVSTNRALQLHSDNYIWLHTGDLGYMDNDGAIFYKGRIKRLIITSGYNVYPSYIESVIESLEPVLQCTVVGIPHPYKKEVPKAFIVLKDGYHGIFVKTKIRLYCKKKLAKYMVPYEFVYRKKLPKTKIGKIDFNKLKNDFEEDDD